MRKPTFVPPPIEPADLLTLEYRELKLRVQGFRTVMSFIVAAVVLCGVGAWLVQTGALSVLS